jgi:DNA-binding LacI/PurR family transcriptional regulator
MSALIRERGLPESLVIPDDIMAQAATRAILEHCDSEARRGLDIVVCGARQTIVPLGLPVIRVVFDAAEMARHTVGILMDQIQGRTDRADSYRVPFSVVTDPMPGVGDQTTPTLPQPAEETAR